MTIQEMHVALKLELDKSDSLNNISFEPEEIDYWLNRAVRLFVKTRYTGSNYKRESFEQTQKRTDDIRTLVESVRIDTIETNGLDFLYSATPITFIAELPLDYMFTVGEQVEIVYNPYPANIFEEVVSGDLDTNIYYQVADGNITHNAVIYEEGEIFMAENDAYEIDPLTPDAYVIRLERGLERVTQVTTDTYIPKLECPFSEHNLYYNSAKPLRLFRENNVVLVGDGHYWIPTYILTYIRQPVTMDLVGSIDCDLPIHTHDEIISMAVDLMVENIESPRIQTRPAVAVTE